ncbi:hypothetical protein VKT23_007266 [Stygiomarasmius scandens]|uniref:DUF6535 domain-containing protein n=1 Tax=Marasmiellus scandens TaxID=2682957 RepID=A0ABR1JNM3_9AGAR
MSEDFDSEKGVKEVESIHGRFKPTPDDDACFKLWNMYIGQAQEYDRALLEGWKSDMDGMLLFSALYSATLTALIIESYQNLREDPADTTVALLRQLILLSNGTMVTLQDPPSFQVTTSSIVCNTFWFLSLALALTCSLLATFVQQWSRDFIHKTTMRPSPVVQARVLAFSYFGLRRFGMHTFVDVIPILLHISLLFFFAGLVAFLLPINLPLMYLMACFLFVFMLVYIGLSCMPLVYLDAPYRTPVSDLLWRLGNLLHGFMLRQHQLPLDLSLTEAMIEKSLKDSSLRDRQIMKYTMKSLNHDTELLPMLEAISEAILSPGGGVRLENAAFVVPLVLSQGPEENVASRISRFISVSGTSADPHRQEKDLQTALRALWCLAHLDIRAWGSWNEYHRTTLFWFDCALPNVLVTSESAPKAFMISALALIRASRLQGLKRCMDIVADKLSTRGVSAHERLRSARDIFEKFSADDVHWESKTFKYHLHELRKIFEDGCLPTLSETFAEKLVDQAKSHLSALQCEGRWKAAVIAILAEFLSLASKSNVTPFEMDTTYNLVCTSLPQVALFDQSLEVEDDEAEASYVIQDIPADPESLAPELFMLLFRLFFSTNRALSRSKCRNVIENYVSSTERLHIVAQDKAAHLEECALQDLRDNDPDEPSTCIVSIYYLYLGMGIHKSEQVSPRLLSFARRIHELIPTASYKFTKTRWWSLTGMYTDWILCKDIRNRANGLVCLGSSDGPSPLESQLVDDARALGRSLLIDHHVPERPNPCTEAEYKQWTNDVRTFAMSMTILMVTKFIILNTEDTDGNLLGDWTWMQRALLYYSGRVYEGVQLQFAESVRRLAFLAPWSQPKESPVYDVFHESIMRLSLDWCWITELKAAEMLLEAVVYHKNHQSFRGVVWFEQALFDRCKLVIDESKKAGILDSE